MPSFQPILPPEWVETQLQGRSGGKPTEVTMLLTFSDRVPGKGRFKRGKIYVDSQPQRFQSMVTGIHVSQGIIVRHRHGRNTRHLVSIMTDKEEKEATKGEQGKIQSPKTQL